MSKKWYLYIGLSGLAYYAYRVAKLAGSHVTNDPSSSTISLGEAARNQASGYYLPVAISALIAYKVL